MEEKGTRRYPVTTLVLYFGEKSWKAPRTVAEAVDYLRGISPVWRNLQTGKLQYVTQ